MSIVLLIAHLVIQLVLAAVVIVGAAFVTWLVWDTTAGPSARAAAGYRRARGGAGR